MVINWGSYPPLLLRCDGPLGAHGISHSLTFLLSNFDNLYPTALHFPLILPLAALSLSPSVPPILISLS